MEWANLKKILSFSLIFILLLFSSCVSAKNPKLKIDFSEKGIEKFLISVIRNSDLDYGKIIEIEGDYLGSYNAHLRVKPKGYQEEYITVKFWNKNDADYVKTVEVIIDDNDTDNLFRCYSSLIAGIERTVARKTEANQYITSLSETRSICLKTTETNDSGTIASYKLNDYTSTLIRAQKYFKYDWYCKYYISTIK